MDLAAVNKALENQKNVVRKLKEEKASKEALGPEIEKLNDLKKKVEEAERSLEDSLKPKNKLADQRKAFEDLLRRRFIVGQAFEIYGGVAGLFDMGPPGAAMKEALISLWRRHFVLEENLLEIECSCLTPEPVLKASGHVDRFSDFMVKDTVTQDCYRADKLIEDFVEKNIGKQPDAAKRERMAKISQEAGAYSAAELRAAVAELGIVSEHGNALSDPYPFNLMFSTSIGPAGNMPGFLRPETAQGIFVNFKRLLDSNGGRLPFGAATIGQAFRNEIAPRSGLLRVREFTLAEIEFFVHPDREHRRHAKFGFVSDKKLPLLTQEAQQQEKGVGDIAWISIGDAVAQGTIANETLGYFIGRTALFLEAAGLHNDPARNSAVYRFRQHRKNEMAHYANDCWDAEIWTSYGWVECVGIADRSCYDLTQHAVHSKTELVAYERYETPQEVLQWVLKTDAKSMGAALKKDLKVVQSQLEGLDEDGKAQVAALAAAGPVFSLKLSDGRAIEMQSSWIQASQQKFKISGRNFVPSVIEPSFGLGRILYSLLEHAYYVRPGEDEARAVLGLSVSIAPYKVVVCPLSGQSEFVPLVEKCRKSLSQHGISCKVDDSGSAIGRRYARSDEIGIPFAVTVDFQTVQDGTVTIRERDGCTQVRCPADDLVGIMTKLVHELWTWKDVREAYPEQQQTASDLVGKTN